MPPDELVGGISTLHIKETSDHNEGDAAARLAQEARQTASFGVRGLRDITTEFAAASTLLPPGQLVKDDYFTLFDAVGALEIMDPKMDSGCVPAGDSFEADFDPCAELDPAEIIWIMDELLCLEITWLDGYPLSQTVFTSLHVDRLLAPENRHPYPFTLGLDVADVQGTAKSLIHSVLRAYCISLIKSCDLVLFWIKGQTYFEEEDFVTHLFGRDLLPMSRPVEVQALLDEAQRQLSALPLAEGVREALKARLLLRRHYLRSVDGEANDWDSLLPQLMSTIHRTHGLGREVTAAFSEKVQRQLATSTPPRPMVKATWEEACKKWTQLFSDMTAICKISTLPEIVRSPHGLQRATWDFAYRDPPPSTFARAKMQDMLFDEQAVAHEMTHFDLLLTDMQHLVLAGDPLVDPESFSVEVTSDPRHINSRILEDFIQRVMDEYLNLYRMVCQNRCRMRRTFTQAIPIWDTLEREAMLIDERLMVTLQASNRSLYLEPPGQITSWTRFHKLRIITWTIQLGFETDIYLPDELGPMYWFLAQQSIEQAYLLHGIDGALSKRVYRLSSGTSPDTAMECLASRDWLRSLAISNELTQMVADALHRFYTLLTAVALLPTLKRDFAQPSLLHDLRLKSFLTVGNSPMPSAEDLQGARILDGTLAEACAAVAADVASARSLLTQLKAMSAAQAKYIGTEERWRREIKQMETTCVALAVAASQLLRIAEKHGCGQAVAGDDLSMLVDCDVPPPGKRRYHDWWVVPQLKEKMAKPTPST